LARIGKIRDEPLPRMADFARWLMEAEWVLGWQDGAFSKAYLDNRRAANQLGLEASVLVGPLSTLVQHQPWMGAATQLLDALVRATDETMRRQRQWPKNGKALSDHLRRLAPNLREIGIDVEFQPRAHGGTRPIRIEKRFEKSR
jgi:hypothetical protein